MYYRWTYLTGSHVLLVVVPHWRTCLRGVHVLKDILWVDMPSGEHILQEISLADGQALQVDMSCGRLCLIEEHVLQENISSGRKCPA